MYIKFYSVIFSASRAYLVHFVFTFLFDASSPKKVMCDFHIQAQEQRENGKQCVRLKTLPQNFFLSSLKYISIYLKKRRKDLFVRQSNLLKLFFN